MSPRSILRTASAIAMAWLLGSAAAYGQTPLTEAARAGDGEAVRTLLAGGADADAAEPDLTRSIHWAAWNDDLSMTEALIAAGADVTAANRYGVSALSMASVNGNAAILERLLEAGADPATTLPEGETVLMTAARTGVVDAVQVLIDHGADINEREAWRGQTALMWAAGEGHAAVVETLIENGADIAASSDGGFTALLFAAREGQISVVRTLLEAGAPVDESLTRRGRGGAGSAGLSAFLLAAANAHYELAALLLEGGADPNAAPLGWTALHQVSWVRKAGISGSNNPAPEGSGSMTSLEFVRKLVEAGADPNARVTRRPPAGITELNMIGGTPFLLAARTADAPLMRLLAELGSDPLLPNADNTSPLMVAAGVGTSSPGEDPGTEVEVLQAVELALELGGDIDGVDDNGETVLHGAAYKHVPSVFEYLFDQGADPGVWNRENSKGWTPLRIAEGVHRGMNIISSPETAAVIRNVMGRAGLSLP